MCFSIVFALVPAPLHMQVGGGRTAVSGAVSGQFLFLSSHDVWSNAIRSGVGRGGALGARVPPLCLRL